MNRFLTAVAVCLMVLTARAADFELRDSKDPEINSVLASVNGEPISLADVLPVTRQEEYQAYAAYSGERLFDTIRRIRLRAVDNLIDRKLIVEDYREKPFEIPTREIEAELDNVAERMGYRSRIEFTRKAREAGTTIEEIRRDIEESMIVQVMLMREFQVHENITPRDIHDYYRNHSEEFVKPESIELAMIQLPADTPELEKITAEIAAALQAAPERFAELAALHSKGPDAANGGNLGWIERRRLRPEFAAAIPNPSAGAVYGPIHTADGVSFLKVLSHREEVRSDFKTLNPEIRRRIQDEERERIRSEYVGRLRRNAVIKYFF